MTRLIKQYFMPNSVIGLLIGTLLTALNSNSPAVNYGLSFIFSFSIGTFAHLFAHTVGRRIKMRKPLYRTLGFIGLLALSGCLGTLLGAAIAVTVFPDKWRFEQYVTYLIGFNLFITLVVGISATIYDRIRGKYEASQLALKEKEIAQRELEHLRTQAELKALQAQVNPHFLFNTLNSIASLIPENPQLAESVVEELADYFRKTLTLSQRLKITLGEEIDLIANYLEIEKVRFGERLEYQIDVPEALTSWEIPALIIQPLVENSIKYAVTQNTGTTQIFVRASQKAGALIIEVRDDGPGLPESWQNDGFGLRSVRSRLKYAYGETAQMHVENDQGARIRLEIPVNATKNEADGKNRL